MRAVVTTVATEGTTLAGGRFVLGTALGTGGMGVVHRAFDTKRGIYVALKSLGTIVDAAAVASFKVEFREFQHLSHPGLVALDELFGEGDTWYFTMEYVAGEDLLAHVRRFAGHVAPPVTELEVTSEGPPSELRLGAGRVEYPGRFDEGRLLGPLEALSEALHYLHRAEKVHCDVTSANVLVRPDGRTVLLDFGVSVDVRAPARLRAATPVYLAPEMLRGVATPAADWYSVGVLLFLAMTGVAPWSGPFAELMEAKLGPVPDPSLLQPDAPPDLVRLTRGLLNPDPLERLGHRDVVRYIEAARGSREASTSVAPLPMPEEIFIGRERELALLRSSFDELMTTSEPVVVYVQGESGIGKTALVQDFRRSMTRAGGHGPLFLAGQVFEDEVVPYKSTDSVIDALVEHLRGLPTAEVLALLPDGFSVVRETFPALMSVPAVAGLPAMTAPDPVERRGLLFGALKECLRRLAVTRPLVITVDDFQWSDEDGLCLWNELLRPPGAPRMLLIATLRSDRTESKRPSRSARSGFLNQLQDHLPERPVPTRNVWLRAFSEDESRAYVEARVLTDATLGGDLPNAELVVAEGNGHPLFLDELLRYTGDALGTGQLGLDSVLRERIASLGPEVRRYLEIVCVTAKPLPRTLIGAAAGLGHGDGLRALKALRAARLVRTARTPGLGGDDWVEPFHYRIRDACVSSMAAGEVAARHRAISEALEGEPRPDAEQLAVHWLAAGDVEKAASYAERAARRAFAALGFRRAAELFADALELARERPTLSVAQELDLREMLARSLRNSGRGRAAAEILLALADKDAERAFDHRCEAAELLLRTGHIDEGTRVVERVMVDGGVEYPQSDGAAFFSLVWRSVRLQVRGTGWRERPLAEIPARDLRALDALYAYSIGLGPVEQLRAFACAAEHSYRALELGEPSRVARALATESITAAAQGNGALSERHAAAARLALARSGERAKTLAIVPASEALAFMMRGRWRNTLSAAATAKAWIRRHTTGAWGELGFVEETELWGLAATGDFVTLVARQEAVAKRAIEQQDLYAGFGARSGLSNLAYLASDLPDRALAETERAVALWSKRGGHLQRMFDALARANVHLYARRPAEAAAVLAKLDAGMPRRLLVPEPVPALMADVRLRVALARALAGGPAPDRAERRLLRELTKGSREWAAGLAALLEAGLAEVDGNSSLAARRAEEAAGLLLAADMVYLSKLASIYSRSQGSGAYAITDLPLGPHAVARPAAMAWTFVPGLRARSSSPSAAPPAPRRDPG